MGWTRRSTDGTPGKLTTTGCRWHRRQCSMSTTHPGHATTVGQHTDIQEFYLPERRFKRIVLSRPSCQSGLPGACESSNRHRQSDGAGTAPTPAAGPVGRRHRAQLDAASGTTSLGDRPRMPDDGHARAEACTARPRPARDAALSPSRNDACTTAPSRPGTRCPRSLHGVVRRHTFPGWRHLSLNTRAAAAGRE